MAFVIFSKHANRHNQPPTISIGKQGRIQLNKSACELFGDLSAIQSVLLLWDKDANKLGIKALPKKDKRAYRFNVNRAGGAALSAKSFIEFIGYDRGKTQWFPAQWNQVEELIEAKLVNVGALSAQQVAKQIDDYRRQRRVS
jgi:hypothetical protein